jgi:hypothetical protein
MKGQHKTRKDALEYIIEELGPFSQNQAADAWKTLLEWIADLSLPETRNPRYNHLVQAIYNSGLRGKRLKPYENDEFQSDRETVSSQDQDRDEAAWLALPQARRSDDGSAQGHGAQKG